MFSNIDAQLHPATRPTCSGSTTATSASTPSQDQLLDLSPYFRTTRSASSSPAMWEGSPYDGAPYGVPHQTDASALLDNTAMVDRRRRRPVTFPTTQDDAWTWDEFADVATQLRAGLPADKYPFAYNWQLGGAPRWLSWLFQAGRPLHRRGRDHAHHRLAPRARRRSTSPRASSRTTGCRRPARSRGRSTPDNLFTERTAAMAFGGVLPRSRPGCAERVRVDRPSDAARRTRRDRPRRQRAGRHEGHAATRSSRPSSSSSWCRPTRCPHSAPRRTSCPPAPTSPATRSSSTSAPT